MMKTVIDVTENKYLQIETKLTTNFKLNLDTGWIIIGDLKIELHRAKYVWLTHLIFEKVEKVLAGESGKERTIERRLKRRLSNIFPQITVNTLKCQYLYVDTGIEEERGWIAIDNMKIELNKAHYIWLSFLLATEVRADGLWGSWDYDGGGDEI